MVGFGHSICLVCVVNAPVATSSLYPTLTCGFSKPVLPSCYTPGNRHHRRAKLGEGLQFCVCLHTRYVCSLPPALPTLPSSFSPHLLFAANSPLPSHLILFTFSLILPFFSPLLLLLSLNLTSTPPFLPLSSPFPPSSWSKKSYGDGDIQSRRWPRRIGRSLASPNLDP
ncbi:unnamed protein product [Schistocephalus solidus]|uniref:Secreted protein n=1 Tax=Schistocephalus solidus TaxID=70667 RepID=A0A183STE7_SCHSO|nr:unnamed protein product [Schistocephalus solidus]